MSYFVQVIPHLKLHQGVKFFMKAVDGAVRDGKVDIFFSLQTRLKVKSVENIICAIFPHVELFIRHVPEAIPEVRLTVKLSGTARRAYHERMDRGWDMDTNDWLI